MKGIGFGLERIGLLAHRFPRVVALIMLAASLVAGLGLTKLQFDDDVVRMMRSPGPYYSDLIRFQADTGRDSNDTIVMVETDAPIDATSLDEVRALHFELALTEGVANVLSAFSLRETGSLIGDTPPVIPEDLTGQDVRSILERARTHPLASGRAVAANHRAMMLVVVADTGVTARQRLAAIEATAASFRATGFNVSVIGLEKTRIEISDTIKRDQLVLNGGGTVLSFLVALLFYRSVRYAAIAFAPGLVALLWLMGGAGLAGTPVGVITGIVPLLVLMLCFTDSMHLVYALRSGLHDGLSRSAAIERALRHVGPACALTSVTTALAFLTLASQYGALTELALFGATGVMLAYIAVIAVFPVVTRVLRAGGSAAETSHEEMGSHWFDGLSAFVSSAPRAIVLAATAAIVLGLAGHLTTKPTFGIYNHIPDGSDTARASLAAERNFGGVFNFWAGIDGDPHALATTAEGWARMVAMRDAMEAVTGKGTVLSPVALGEALGRPGPMSPDDIATLPDAALDAFGGRTGERTYLGVLVGDQNASPENAAQFRRLLDAVESAGATSLVGTPVVAWFEGRRIIGTLSLSLLGAAFATIGCIMLAFRTLRLLPAIVLANILPIVLAGAGLHIYASGELTMTSAVCLTIAFGIAVDNTIHFLNRVAIERRAGAGHPESVQLAIRHVGIVLLAASVILASGVALTATSSFPNTRLFGLIFDIILALALVGSLVVLPAAMLVWRAWQRERIARGE